MMSSHVVLAQLGVGVDISAVEGMVTAWNHKVLGLMSICACGYARIQEKSVSSVMN